MPNAEIVAIGSELLLGQIVDTNSAWMAQRLSDLGVNLFFKTIVGDNPGRMKDVIGRALDRADFVITSGGLGPTQDDLTREIIAEVCGRKLVRDPGLLDQIDTRFRRRGMIMTPNNERQADIPEGAIPVENPNGTAPSFIVEHEKGVIFALPGVPHEMKWLFENEVTPYARRKWDLSETITYRVLKVTDMGESSVDHEIGDLIANSSNPTVGVLAHPGQVDVRITAKGVEPRGGHEAHRAGGGAGPRPPHHSHLRRGRRDHGRRGGPAASGEGPERGRLRGHDRGARGRPPAAGQQGALRGGHGGAGRAGDAAGCWRTHAGRTTPKRCWNSPSRSPRNWPGPFGGRPEATWAWRSTRWRTPATPRSTSPGARPTYRSPMARNSRRAPTTSAAVAAPTAPA